MIILAMLACFTLSGPNITAGELSQAVPGMTPRNPSAVVSYSPNPGVKRVFHPFELNQLLRRIGFAGAAVRDDVCFERTAAPLKSNVVEEAMRRSLGAGAHIEILEISRFAAPPGLIVFPLETLGPPPVSLWRGFVEYDGHKKFAIWARAKVTVDAMRVVALQKLQAGIPIQSDLVTLKRVNEFPKERAESPSFEEVVHSVPRRTIPALSTISSEAIEVAADVSKGDRVVVKVHSGRAQLAFEAEAAGSAHRGQMVSLKNPESGRLFRARVEGPDKAVVTTISEKL